MNKFQLYSDANEMGILETQLSSSKIQKLYEEFKNDINIIHSDDIEEFIEWLVENNHDTEANRFFVDETIIF